MRKFTLVAAGVFGVLSASSATAATYIPIIPVAGATQTLASAINDKNEITGVYFDSEGVLHGYAGTLDGDYQTFDAGSTNTEPAAIDKKGDIVGTAYASFPNCTASAFERNAKGTIQPIKKGGTAISGSTSGMDAGGDFVGSYCDGSGSHPFVGKKAKYKKAITLSGAHILVFPSGIDSAGDIDGSVQDPDSKIRGFLLKDGTTTEVTFPGADQTQFSGLNDKGVASGLYITAGKTHGFAYDIATATFTSVEPTGATSSVAGSINNDGLVAINSDIGAFIYCPLKKNRCPTNGTH
jgi:hypothetical protein